MNFGILKKESSTKPLQNKKSKGLSSALVITISLVILLLSGSGLWLAYQADWNLEELLELMGIEPTQKTIFASNRGFTQDEARNIYLKARTSLDNEKYVEAISGFKSIEKAYPGLLDLILIHEAEAYAKIPDEFRAQQALSQALQKRPKSKFAPKIRYQRAQSHLRAKEYDEAHQDFKAVIRLYPDSDYAIGSHYYMGVLIRKEAASSHEKKVLKYWRRYLTEMPEGRFSYDIASQMDEILPTSQQSTEDHRLIGLGYAHSERAWEKAIKHLSRVPLADVWLELGRAQLKTGQNQAGLNTLAQGIVLNTKGKAQVQEGVNMLVRNSNKGKAIQRLKAISQKANAKKLEGGDYILWKLSQLNPSQSRSYYQEILRYYPDGDYSPESSWQLLWPLIRSGNHANFLSKSEAHLKRYPYARSAAQTLFWRGKILEKQGQINDATWAYQKILKSYPVSYYAFRASGRLTYLKEDAGDPGWRLKKTRQYPPTKDRQIISVLSDLSHLKSESQSPEEDTFWKSLAELEAIGAIDDLPLMLNAQLGYVPAIVESQQWHSKGDRPRGIRIIRDELYKRAREGNLAGFNPSRNEMKLLYPLYFTQSIQKEAPANKLDPFIVQSLMREESYFNELAVSSSNALGLMQLLPSTAKEVAGWVGISSFQKVSLFQPTVNIKLGSRYLGHLHQLFNGDSMLSVGAYNGGPNAMKRWIRNSPVFAHDRDMFVEMIPYAQTRNYIKKVYGSFWNYSRLYPETGSKNN